jgi:hypothetical protein
MFVACKVPNGMLISGAGRQVTLLGPNKVQVQDRAGGYAITEGVDGELWAAWLKANADSDAVRNNIVFAEEDLNVLKGRAWSRNKVQGFNNPTFKMG